MWNITVIGAGNMGGAMARGWAGAFGGRYVTVANPSLPKLEALKAEHPEINVTTDNVEAASGADIIVLAVKPWRMAEVVGQMRESLLRPGCIVVSVAAGIFPEDILEMIGEPQCSPAIVYCIPNTAVAVGEGMTFYTGFNLSDSQRDVISRLFAPLGTVMEVEPRQMNAGMAVASCGIAYAMRYIRAAVEGGVELGLRPAEAQAAVVQTLKGAAALLENNGSHPEQEIDKVTTPGGLTIRGLNAMEEAGFTASVVSGLRHSVK